jgi:hypothetical protein
MAGAGSAESGVLQGLALNNTFVILIFLVRGKDF